MRDLGRIGAGSAHRERARWRGFTAVEGRKGLAQHGIGVGVCQRYPILRAPMDLTAESLDETVCGDDLSPIVENQRGQAHQRQRLGGSAGALQLETG